MYYEGRGVAKDHKEALKWYGLAANQGLAAAQGNLGWIYDQGNGVVNNREEAVKCYQIAANQGDAMAQNNLGLMYKKDSVLSRIIKRRSNGIGSPLGKGMQARKRTLGLCMIWVAASRKAIFERIFGIE